MAITGYAVTFDCADAQEVARFWAAVFEQPVNPDATAEFASIGGVDARVHLMFASVPEGKQVKNRVHLDLFAHDLDAEVDRVGGLGATVRSTVTDGGRWTTMTDPHGNEFDVVAAD